MRTNLWGTCRSCWESLSTASWQESRDPWVAAAHSRPHSATPSCCCCCCCCCCCYCCCCWWEWAWWRCGKSAAAAQHDTRWARCHLLSWPPREEDDIFLGLKHGKWRYFRTKTLQKRRWRLLKHCKSAAAPQCDRRWARCRLLSWPPGEEDDILFRLESRQKRIWRYFRTKNAAKAQMSIIKTLQKRNCRETWQTVRVLLPDLL